MQETILIVDDEKDIADMLQDYFMMDGYRVQVALSGEEAIQKAQQGPDIILLDIGLPDIDGLQVCKHIRNHVNCPIVFLTARVEEEDKVRGLASGGDDYIIKPFSLVELKARIKSHLRRERRSHTRAYVKFEKGLVVDYLQRCLYIDNELIAMPKREFDIIEFLSMNPGQVFGKERMYDAIWGLDGEGDSAVIVEHIRRIRSKLAAKECADVIETVWGVGYKWIRK